MDIDKSLDELRDIIRDFDLNSYDLSIDIKKIVDDDKIDNHIKEYFIINKNKDLHIIGLVNAHIYKVTDKIYDILKEVSDRIDKRNEYKKIIVITTIASIPGLLSLFLTIHGTDSESINGLVNILKNFFSILM